MFHAFDNTGPNRPTPRPEWMALLSRAPLPLLEQALSAPAAAPLQWLRKPETGLYMVQGRAGGTGQRFNLGEMTVTRCALRIEAGAVGHGHVQGRDKDHARRAAVLDALMQGEQADALRASVLEVLQAEETARRATRAAKAAATRVEFFTMVRGEDQ